MSATAPISYAFADTAPYSQPKALSVTMIKIENICFETDIHPSAAVCEYPQIPGAS
jgi:hypothetical protein